ncbi:chromosome segregation ATPases [Vibrio variabilis]|uniref:Chromosome segregation ATPases n=1 Tax=Vibrio variabilis TaxID=990271 RepID=A0ABQ0JJF6_9VIBR|nr:chromosome segregation ATPases [Vibrio variabilis]
MLSFGFQRLALIGSAGYQRAELPLDDSVSLIAPNNHGKTSLINALQFLLIIDQRRMDFGSHTLEKARRFYFPNNSAYILLEVILPQTGTVVFGCVGKGVGYDYEYFAYKGELNLDDFRLEDGNIVSQPKLVNHLATKKHRVYKFNDKEFRHSIYGGAKSKKSSDIDFTVFKLEHVSDARSFQQVLTKTLRLDKLNSSDVKDYLLTIFSRELPNASIDFKQEWEKAFQDINLEREQYLAAVNNRDTIFDLEKKFERTLALRGKIATYQPKVNALLQDWHGHVQTTTESLLARKNKLEQSQQELRDKDFTRVSERKDLTNFLADLNRTEKQQQELEQYFSLIPGQLFLESQLKSAEQSYGDQIALCVQLQRNSSAALSKQLEEREQLLQRLQAQHQTLGDNLYLHLSKVLNAQELEKLNKVLSQQVMQLSPEQYSFDINQLRSVLNAGAKKQLSLVGLTLSIDELLPQHVQKTEQELLKDIDSVKGQIHELNTLLEASKESEAAESRKRELKSTVKQCEQDLTDYQLLQQLKMELPQREQQRQTYENDLAILTTALQNSGKMHNELVQKIGEVADKLNQLSLDDGSVERLKKQRIDDQTLFSSLSQQTHTPWIMTGEWSLDSLPAHLEQFVDDCKELDKLSREMYQLKSALNQKGLTKFQMAQTQDEELKGIIQFSQHLDDEKRALERRARSAVVNVTASLGSCAVVSMHCKVR